MLIGRCATCRGHIPASGTSLVAVNDKRLNAAQLAGLDSMAMDAITITVRDADFHRPQSFRAASPAPAAPMAQATHTAPAPTTRRSAPPQSLDLDLRRVALPRGPLGYGISVETVRKGAHRVVKMSPPAKAAGLRLRDMIASVDGVDVTAMQHTAITGLLKESRGTLQLMVGQNRAAASVTVDGSEELKVLCCSANVGNAEIEALGSWIPQGGIIPGGGSEQYGVVAVGMQEALYKLDGDGNDRGHEDGGSSSDSSDSDDDHAHSPRGTKKKPKAKHNKDGAVKNLLSDKIHGKCSKHILQKLNETLPGYTLVDKIRRMEMRLFVFVRDDLKNTVRAVENSAENTGYSWLGLARFLKTVSFYGGGLGAH